MAEYLRKSSFDAEIIIMSNMMQISLSCQKTLLEKIHDM